MTIGSALGRLGKLAALVGLLGAVWSFAQRQALERAHREQVSVAAAARPSVDVDAASASRELLERLVAARATPAPSAVASGRPGSGAVPDDLERVEEFQRQVHLRAEQTASLVRSPADLEPVLAEIERDIERSRRVNAFHAKSSVAAVRAAYRDRPEEELEARLLELDRRLMDLSAKFEPLVREGLSAGAARQNRFD
jgi:hypothetical protein